MIPNGINQTLRGQVQQTLAPLSSRPAVVGSLGTLGQECMLRPLALLVARELLQLRRTVDTPAQAKVHDLDIVNGDGFHGDPPRLSTVPDLRECAVPPPIQPPSQQCDVVVSHQRRHRFDHKADRVDEHVRLVEGRRNHIGAVGEGPWQRWAALLKNVSFKAMKIHNF